LEQCALRYPSHFNPEGAGRLYVQKKLGSKEMVLFTTALLSSKEKLALANSGDLNPLYKAKLKGDIWNV
jgi:hypothetical protein